MRCGAPGQLGSVELRPPRCHGQQRRRLHGPALGPHGQAHHPPGGAYRLRVGDQRGVVDDRFGRCLVGLAPVGQHCQRVADCAGGPRPPGQPARHLTSGELVARPAGQESRDLSAQFAVPQPSSGPGAGGRAGCRRAGWRRGWGRHRAWSFHVRAGGRRVRGHNPIAGRHSSRRACNSFDFPDPWWQFKDNSNPRRTQ